MKTYTYLCVRNFATFRFGSTKCINHWADSANFKGVTLNKLCSGLTGNCFEMPNASYTNRYAPKKQNI